LVAIYSRNVNKRDSHIHLHPHTGKQIHIKAADAHECFKKRIRKWQRDWLSVSIGVRVCVVCVRLDAGKGF